MGVREDTPMNLREPFQDSKYGMAAGDRYRRVSTRLNQGTCGRTKPRNEEILAVRRSKLRATPLLSDYSYRRTGPGHDGRRRGFLPRAIEGRLAGRTAAAQRVKHNFDPAGDSQFVENPEEIVLNGMLPERKPLCNFAVGEPFGHAVHYVEFACRKQRVSSDASNAHRSGLRDGFQQVVQLIAAGPDLTLMNTENALGELFQGFGAAKDTPGSRAEGLNYRCPLGGIQQQNHAGRRRIGTNLATQKESCSAVISLPCADQGYVRLLALRPGENLGRLGGRPGHIKLSISRQCLHQQLRVHGGAVSSQYANATLRKKAGQLSHD